MRKLLKRKVAEQNRTEYAQSATHEFTDYNDIVPDHKNPKEWGSLER
jgi:hypothetical protein